jgi:hypothetical protein
VCTEEEQAHLKTPAERYTSQGASGAWRVHRWRLAFVLLVLGDTEDRNDVSRQWHDEWPLETSVESLIFQWLRETFLPMLVKEPAEYPKSDQDNASRETLLPDKRYCYGGNNTSQQYACYLVYVLSAYGRRS